MIRKICLGICGRAASIAVASLFTVAIFGISGFAQATQSVPGGTVLKPVSPPAFLVAPSLSLGYAPTSVAAGALTPSGRTDLVTADYNAGKITVFVGLGQGSFAPGISVAAGAQPTSLVVADVDGDGRADVVLANPSEGVISVFAGNGDGTLGARKTFAIGFAPSLVAVGDFTGNGNQDIAVAGAAGKSLAILQNIGSGNLNRAVNYALGSTPAALIAADLNHDGHLDLAIANTSGTVTVFLGKGNGQFSAQPDIIAANGALTSIAVGDFNRDGDADLVVTSASLNQAAVLLGKGDGSFASAVLLAVGNSPIATHVADVDGDHIPDLIVINKGSNTFSVLNGLGDGTFKSAANFVVGNAPLGAAAADFYGNGRVDVATIDQLGQTLSVPAGMGDGTFAAGRAYVAGVQPVAVASGDLTGSGKSDLVVANYCGSDATCGGSGSAAVLLAGPGGVYQLASTYTMGAGTAAIHLVDVNGDGKLDMVALNRADKSLSVRLGAGDGTFGKLATVPLSAAPISMAAADFNKDGKIDLAVLGDCGSASCSQPGTVEFLMGAGDDNFHSVATHATGFAPVAIVAGKTSPGGNTDVVIANRCGMDVSCKSGGTATLLLGDGAGAFKPASDLALGNSPASIALADLHGTGNLDLVVSRSSDNTVAVLPGIGKGSFGAAVPYAVGHAPCTLVIADFNGDGLPDVAVANTADSSVSVLFGKAGGTLQPAFAVPVAGSPSSLAALGSGTGRASLATPSGSITAPSSASNVTVVPNLIYHPYAGVTANTTTLTATPNTTTVNAAAPVTLNVTVTGGSGTPTGTVDITSNGSPATVCSGLILTGAGTASCTTSALQVSVTTLTATYNGDATYAIGTGTASITVNAATPIINLTPSPASPSGVNTQVTFTATLTGAPLTPVTPTGTMTFKVDGTTVAACTATVTSAGVATCPVSDLAVGVRTVTATYSGDTNFVVAAPGSASYTITKASPTVVTTTPSNPTALNASVTFTASLGSVPFTPTAPGGTVAFSLDGTGIAACATQSLNSSQQATCAIQNMAGGSHSITAVYTGDANFNGATSADLPHTITAVTPTVTVTTGGGSSTALNASITFTATLSGVAFSPVPPGGTVSFSSNGNAIAGCAAQALNGSQQATCTTSGLAAGTDTITATLAADTNFNTATSAGLPHTVTKLTPTVTVTASTGTTSAVNAPVTFTATLSGVAFAPVAPGATVNFQANGATIASCGTQAVNASQQATCTTSALTTNPSIPITAVYAGDSNFNAATSAALTYSVTPSTPTLTITSSQNPAPVGTSLTFTAALGGVAFTPTVPNGTVTWKINGSASSDCPAGAVNASQKATCTTSALVSPADTITATYSGDNNFTVSAATTFTQTVGKSGTTVNLTALPSSTSVNVPVVFTATVPGPTSGAPFPTGSVTFTQGANTLCGAPVVLSTPTPPLNAGNQPKAACTAPFSVANSYPVVANYSGDANFAAGSSNQVSVTIGADATTTSITYSGTPSVNAPLVFSPQVVPNDTGTAKPQGNVALIVTGTPAPTFGCTNGTVAVTNGTAPSCSITFGATGNYTVKATFTPSDTNFSTSTSSTTSLTIATGTAGVIVSSGGPSNVNATVTFTASFSQAINGTQPTGTVTYTDTFNGNPSTLCTRTLSGGVMPSCDFAFAVAGTHSVIAAYSGDGNFKAASSDPFTQPVSQTGTATAVTSSLPAGSSVNQSVNFTATVSPANTGTAVPNGKVIFSYTAPGGGSATPICGTGMTVAKSGSNATASCSAALPAAGTGYTISASYGGDSNFLVGTAGTVSQNVTATSTTTSVGQPASAAVNQPVTYTATVTPAFTGSTAPTGKVSFTDTSTTPNTDLCPGGVALTAAGNAYEASCIVTFDTVRTGDSIVATYTSGDSNFNGSAAPPVTQVIGKSATTLKVTSSLPGGSVATQAVTFTAVLAPGFTVPGGGLAPSGNILFALTNDPADACVITQNSPYTASCTLPAISSTVQSGKITVAATYAGDGNFVSSTGNVDQIVGNFSLAFNAPTGGSISLTQFTGATTTQDNTNDPFTPQAVSVLVTPTAGYGHQLDFTCQVADSTGHGVTDPSCNVSPANPLAAPNLKVAVILSASAQAPVGAYTANLVAVDNALTTLQQVTTNPLTVNVVGVTGTLTLAQTGTGTASAIFNTAGASSTSLTTFSCSVKPAPVAGKVSCTGPSGCQPVTGAATTVPITLTLSSGSGAAISPGGLSAASFMGLPVLALLGWLGCRRSRRRNFFRIVGLLLLGIGLSCVTACGGSFTRPTPPTNQGMTPGSYLVQVTATGNDNKLYYAVVPLVVNGN